MSVLSYSQDPSACNIHRFWELGHGYILEVPLYSAYHGSFVVYLSDQAYVTPFVAPKFQSHLIQYIQMGNGQSMSEASVGTDELSPTRGIL